MNYLYTLSGIIIGILLCGFSRPIREKGDELLDKIAEGIKIESNTSGKAMFVDPITREQRWLEAEKVDDLLQQEK